MEYLIPTPCLAGALGCAYALTRTGSEQSPAAAEAHGTNFSAVTDDFKEDSYFGPLSREDLQWNCPTYISTETQTWYAIVEDGAFVMFQIIYSPIGIWNPQVRMTFKYFNPKTGKKVWKSVSVSSFKVLDDKVSCQSEIFTIKLKDSADGGEEYEVNAKLDNDVQLVCSFIRPATCPGWKLGNDATGGISYFGKRGDERAPGVKHRFWPYARTQGVILMSGQVIDAAGQGCFVQALQGMRPNLVAARWNFGWFQSNDQGGTSAIMMEFTTTPDYGKANDQDKREPQVVTFGSVTNQGKLISVVGSTRSVMQTGDSQSRHSNTRVAHLDRVHDAETGYDVPQSMRFTWDGPAITDGNVSPSARVSAETVVPLGSSTASNGLIDKVDVLAEIPLVVRKVVNYVAGTKPYIYQTLNEVELSLRVPDNEPQSIKGTLFEEHTFISQ